MFYFISFILCLILSFSLNLALMIIISRHGRNRLKPFIYGTVCMTLTHLVAIRYLNKFINVFYSGNVAITHNKIFFGLSKNILSAIVIDFIIYEVIYWLNYTGNWTSTIDRNFSFGLGLGWAYSFCVEGLYCVNMIHDYIKGNLSWFGSYDLMYIWNLLLECTLYSFLFIAIVFILEYGIVKSCGTKSLWISIGVHSIMGMQLYFLQYYFFWPLIISEIIFGVVVFFLFKKSYYTLRKEQYHHRRRK